MDKIGYNSFNAKLLEVSIEKNKNLSCAAKWQ